MSCCSDSGGGGGGGGGGGDCSVAGKISPNASTTASTIASESKGSSNAHLKEHDYIGLSEVSSNLEGTPSLTLNLNLKETELRLGPPGSVSPQRDDSHAPELSLMSSVRTDVEEKELFPIAGRNAQKAMPMAVSGAKRGFAEAMSGKGNGYSAERDSWVYNTKQGGGDVGGLDAAAELKSSQGKVNGAALKQGPPSSWHDLDHSATSFRAGAAPSRPLKEAIMKKDTSTQDRTPSKMMAPLPDSTSMAPPPKAAVVGWPPIRSFRKNTLAAAPKANEDGDGKSGSSALYVKVSMDGAPYLRKVDLKMYNCYPELSSALEKMFSCFTIGQCGTHGTTGRDGLSESKLMDFLHGSEYVLTYEDKDGDWMLVGDVPWEMFSESCKRLRIMKGSEAIGLAPRAMEKCRNRN